MKDTRFNALLAASKPEDYRTDKNFTNTVMKSVQSSEILSSAIRNMDVTKKETFIMKLKHLPKVAIIAIAVGLVALLGGTTYAVYKTLWEQPGVTVETPTTNQFGRTQVIASFENCSDQTAATTFEIKSGSTLDPSEVDKILKARCEMDVLREWSGANNPPKGPNPEQQQTPGTYSETMTMVSPVASNIASIDNKSLVLTGDEYNSPKKPLTLSPETEYIVDNHQSTIENIKQGDTVLYVEQATFTFVTKQTDTGVDTTSEYSSQITTHVIKVELPFEYYGPGKQNQIAEREACYGNPQDSCVQGASVDLYDQFNNILKDDGAGGFTNEMRTIQGIITEHTGNIIKIQSSSGRIFTLTTPRDIIADFNQNRSAEYNDTKVEIGDLLIVGYVTDKNSTDLSLNISTINTVYLSLNLIQKGDPIKKY